MVGDRMGFRGGRGPGWGRSILTEITVPFEKFLDFFQWYFPQSDTPLYLC